MKVVPLRFQPGDDLRWALKAWIGKQGESAGCVLLGIGNLSVAELQISPRAPGAQAAAAVPPA